MTLAGREDRAVNWLLYAIGLVAALTLAVAAFGLREIAAGNTTLEAQRQSDRMDSCRASYRAAIDDATVDLLIAQAASDELIRRGFAALALGDGELLSEVAQAAAPANARVQMAIEEVAEATDANAEALRLARDDPKKFLATCPDPERAARELSEPAPDLRLPAAPSTSASTTPNTTRPSRSPAAGREPPHRACERDGSSPSPTSSSTTSTTTTTTTSSTTTTTTPADEICFGPVCLER